MSTKEIIDAMNKDLADELAAIIQYLMHHYLGEGMDTPGILGMFEATAKDEMKHFEMISERIVYLGGTPTTKPSDIKTGGDLKKMIQDDLASENGAIRQYKEHIKLCADDPGTRLMLEKILLDEEGHADNWETVLGVRK